MRKKLIDIRARYDLTQQEMAKIAGISQSTYQGVERGRTSLQSDSAKLIKQKIIDNKESIAIFRKKELEIQNKHRIPNISSFYDLVYELEEKHGSLSEARHDPTMKEIHRLLGVDVPNKRTGKRQRVALKERKEFTALLKKYRGNLGKSEFARRLGLLPTSYSPVELNQRGTSSAIVQNLIQNDYLSKNQREELQEVYHRMKVAEQRWK